MFELLLLFNRVFAGFPMLGFSISSNYLAGHQERIWKTINNYSDAEFCYHFRVSRPIFEHVTDFLASNGFKAENGSKQSTRQMLYMTLKYLGKKGKLF